MKIAYLDAFSGISGDMVVGAIIDAGVPIAYLRRELKKLDLKGYSISARKIERSSITATSFTVKQTAKQKSRNYRAIKKLIEKSALSKNVKKISIDIFHKIAEAEAKVHGRTMEDVHFHEVGAVDSIIDIVGAAIGFEKLGIKSFVSSHIPTGSGFVKTSHGIMPVPAPATILILKSVPIKGSDIEMELTTPTGAAIAAALCKSFGGMPPMKPDVVGYGAGTKERPDKVPNLFRLVIGETKGASKQLTVLETNIDDATPELLGHVTEKLLESGALDAWLAPISMKKGRQAFCLSVLCNPEDAGKLRTIVLEETPTLGLRQYGVERFELDRKTVKVKTKYGTLRVKIAATPSGGNRIKPEYDDVNRLAKKNGTTFAKVYSATTECFRYQLRQSRKI